MKELSKKATTKSTKNSEKDTSNPTKNSKKTTSMPTKIQQKVLRVDQKNHLGHNQSIDVQDLRKPKKYATAAACVCTSVISSNSDDGTVYLLMIAKLMRTAMCARLVVSHMEVRQKD